MKLPVVSTDFETHKVTFKMTPEVSDKCSWCFGDVCDVDLSVQVFVNRITSNCIFPCLLNGT